MKTFTLPKNNKKKPNNSKLEIMNWLKEMKYEERMKVFSIVNYDICKAILKMYEKFSSSNTTKFKINFRDKKPIFSHVTNMFSSINQL